MLVKYIKPFTKEIILGPAFKLLEAILELNIPIIMALLIDEGILIRNKTNVSLYGGFIFLLTLAGFISATICQYFAAKASQGVGTRLRKDFMHHLHNLKVSDFHHFSKASLSTRMNMDIYQFQLGVAYFIRLGVRVPFLLISSMVMSYLIHRKLSLVFMLVGLIISVIFAFVFQKLVYLQKEKQKNIEENYRVTEDFYLGIPTMKAFWATQKSEDKVNKYNYKLYQTSHFLMRYQIFLLPISTLILYVGIGKILQWGSIEIMNHQLSPGKLLALINYCIELSILLMVVITLIPIYTKAYSSYDRLREFFFLKSDIENKSVSKLGNKNEIILSNVSFAYPKAGKEVISRINLNLKEGKTYGLLGKTGSGKSTLLKILAGIYPPNSGTIDCYQKKEDFFDFITGSLEGMGLFSDTIRKNLWMVNPRASEDDMWRALSLAKADGFVNSFPEGIDTDLLEQGSFLSGGQRQRLLIARALMRKTPFLILDNCFTSLDNETLKQVRQNILSLSHHPGIIIASQRINQIQDLDEIILMDGGNIVGRGNHEALLSTSNLYQEIYQSQLGGEIFNEN